MISVTDINAFRPANFVTGSPTRMENQKENSWWFPLGVLLLVFHPGWAACDEVRWTESINVGNRYHGEGKYAEAEKAYLTALKEAEQFPEEDPRLSVSLNNLGFLYYDQGRYGEAEPL